MERSKELKGSSHQKVPRVCASMYQGAFVNMFERGHYYLIEYQDSTSDCKGALYFSHVVRSLALFCFSWSVDFPLSTDDHFIVCASATVAS